MWVRMNLELVECTDRAGVENEDLYLKKPDVRQPFELQSAAVQYTSQLRLLQSPATELDFPIVNDQRSELRQAARLLKVAQAANSLTLIVVRPGLSSHTLAALMTAFDHSFRRLRGDMTLGSGRPCSLASFDSPVLS